MIDTAYSAIAVASYSFMALVVGIEKPLAG